MREFVSVHVVDGVGTLVLSRPPTNTLTRQMCREIDSAATELGESADVAAVVAFGGHEIFSAGADVGEARTIGADAAAVATAVALRAVADIPKPTVAAVTGYALGSGLTLALTADWRIGGDNVKWGATQILEGLAPSHDDAELLARAIGDAHAKELAFTGRFAHAKEALELGLVDELVAPDHVYDAAVAWARRFVDVSPEALAAAKAAFRPASPGR